MRSATAIVLLALVRQHHADEFSVKRGDKDSKDELTNIVVDTLVDKFFNWAFRSSFLHRAGLENITLLAALQGSAIHKPHIASCACVSPRIVLQRAPPASAAGLKLLNSLTQKVEPFKPLNPALVKWYICGPTVYDSAHVGHARNYVAFDIVRRVLRDYFGFGLFYVMGVTDIDDKIIMRTHRNHLEAMVDELSGAGVDLSKHDGLGNAHASAKAVLATAKPELKELIQAQRELSSAASAASIKLVTGGECDVQNAFLDLTYAFEQEFFEDLAKLSCLPPDAITRVTDYVPEIIAYIEKIMANGYCYESGGSVYFDTATFLSTPNMSYGKLVPSKAGRSGQEEDNAWTEGKTTAELLAEGEGALSAGSEAEKRNPADFALWKASKEGEPSWQSPWGLGRPGWHIECSAMASDLLGDKVDLNAGGVDLKFPHHENQMAQAEAHFDCCSWVNCFLHTGHLHIDGLKMSKSLKNFITIRGALTAYSPAQIRFLFLLRRFSEPMEYSENTLRNAADLERRFSSFSAVLALRLKEAGQAIAQEGGTATEGKQQQLRTAGVGGPPIPKIAPTHKWSKEERELHAELVARRAAVHAALLDSIDTPRAISALEQLISATFVYMTAVPDVTRGVTLLTDVYNYHMRMMSIFGLTQPVAPGSDGSGSRGDTASPEDIAQALSRFRDQVRLQAIEDITNRKKGVVDDAKLAEEMLRISDMLRDEVLPGLGVQLDDRASGVAQVKMGDPKLLKAEAERKIEEKAKLAAEKQAKAEKKAAAAAAEAARAKISPAAMFAPEHDELFERESPAYGAFDAEGLPTETAAGEQISKSLRKKLIKQMDKQSKAHAAYLESREAA